ncbi:unnamed protein product [Pichia kudriavzevii]
MSSYYDNDNNEFVKSVSIPKASDHHRHPSVSNNALARSFVYSSFKPGSSFSPNSKSLQVHSSDSIHEDSADLAEIAVTDFNNIDSEYSNPPLILTKDDSGTTLNDSYSTQVMSDQNGVPSPLLLPNQKPSLWII